MSTPDFAELQFKPKTAEDRQTVHPWRRYFARSFDVILFSIISLLVLSILGFIVAAETTEQFLALFEDGWKGKVISSVVGLALALPVIALLQSFLGTPGKWLFGVRVRNAEGNRLSVVASFKREILVAVKGMGCGIPVITSIMMILANLRLTSHGVTTWDEQMRCQVTYAPMNAMGYIKAVLGGTIVVGVLLYTHFSNIVAG